MRSWTYDDTTDTLTPILGFPSTPHVANAIALHPNGKILFAFVGQDAAIHAYNVGSDGTLTELDGSPYAADSFPTAGTIDPSGKWLAVAMIGKVAMYAIDAATGTLTPVPGSPFTVGPVPGRPVFSAQSARLYVPVRDTDLIAGYAVEPTTGALTALASSPYLVGSGTAPVSVDLDPTERLAYVGGEFSPYTHTFTVGVAGELIAGPRVRAAGSSGYGTLFLTGPTAVSSSPKYVYALDNANTAKPIASYAMSSSGALTAIPGSPPSLAYAMAAAVEPRGRRLYALGGNDGLHTYTIGGTGALQELAVSPSAIPNNPLGLAIDPAGRWLYVICGGSTSVLSYSLDAVTGAPSYVGSAMTVGATPSAVAMPPGGYAVWVSSVGDDTITFGGMVTTSGSPLFSATTFSTGAGSDPSSIAFSPDGRHVYVALSGTQKVAGYAVSEFSNVAPAAVPGSPYAVGKSPQGVAVDPSGRYVYVTESGSFLGSGAGNHVAAFVRDPSTGALTPASPSTTTSLPRPYGIAVDSSAGFVVAAATGTTSPLAQGGLSIFPIQAGGGLAAPTDTTFGGYVWSLALWGERN